MKILKYTFFILLYFLSIRFLLSDFYVEVANAVYQPMVVDKMIENFYEKEAEFDNFFEIANEIGSVDNLTFFEGREVHLKISNIDTIDVYDETIYLSIENDSINSIYYGYYNPCFSDIKMLIKDSVFLGKKMAGWTIDFEGDYDSDFGKYLLNHVGLNEEKLVLLRDKLISLDCSSISKSPEWFSLRYTGHLFESYEYVYSKRIDKHDTNRLNTNYYWSFSQFSLWCAVSDWEYFYWDKVL